MPIFQYPQPIFKYSFPIIKYPRISRYSPIFDYPKWLDIPYASGLLNNCRRIHENDLMLLSLRKSFEERRERNPDVYRGHSKYSSSIVI